MTFNEDIETTNAGTDYCDPDQWSSQVKRILATNTAMMVKTTGVPAPDVAPE